MSYRARRWTISDNELLKSLAARRPAAEIATRLGRSLGATFVQASKLNISLRVPRREPKQNQASSGDTPMTDRSSLR
jgi:hypothetical protein